MVNSESSACHQRCAPQIEVRSRQEQRSLALLNACLNNITPDDSSSGVAARPVCRRSSAEAADLNVLAPSVTSVLPFFPTLAPKMVTRTFNEEVSRWHKVLNYFGNYPALSGVCIRTFPQWKLLPFIWGLFYSMQCPVVLHAKHVLYSSLY